MNEANLRQVLKMQEDNYNKRKGKVIGDFIVDDVYYDWDRHKQLWNIRCQKCGDVRIINSDKGREIQRGKQSQRCKKCKAAERKEQKAQEDAKRETEKIERAMQKESELDSYIGQIINGWTVLSRGGNTYEVCCTICGKNRSVQKKELVEIKPCKHPQDYSSQEWIGKKFGHLTILEKRGKKFLCMCDCGREKLYHSNHVATNKVTSCGDPDCEYHIGIVTNGEITRKSGLNFETQLAEKLVTLGYEIEHTPVSGDYGVDIIVNTSRHRTAIQSKLNGKSGDKVGVKAVMEVYAGGHFYDCDQYAVVSKTGYTENAVTMAKKLNVLLMNEDFKQLNDNEMQKAMIKRYATINGVTKTVYRWCLEYGKDPNRINHLIRDCGVEPVDAILQEKRIPLNKICEGYGLSAATVSYRMKTLGMSLDEALTTPKSQGHKFVKVDGKWERSKDKKKIN